MQRHDRAAVRHQRAQQRDVLLPISQQNVLAAGRELHARQAVRRADAAGAAGNITRGSVDALVLRAAGSGALAGVNQVRPRHDS